MKKARKFEINTCLMENVFGFRYYFKLFFATHNENTYKEQHNSGYYRYEHANETNLSPWHEFV